MLMITGGAVGIIMCDARLSGTERRGRLGGRETCSDEFETADGPTAGGGRFGGGGAGWSGARGGDDVEDDNADTDGIPTSRQDRRKWKPPPPKQKHEPIQGEPG